VLAFVILREPITLKKAGGILLGASGALILVMSSSSTNAGKGANPMLGDLLVLIAQLSYALYLTLYRNFIRKYSLVTMMKWMFTFAAIILIPFSASSIASLQWSLITPENIAGIAYVVICGTFISYICIMIGQKNLRPTLVGMYNYVQPIVASLVGVYLGLDRFTPLKIFAVILIFSGVYLVAISKAKKEG
jgi:drug/metabolite transporter (DMT)-like permease